MFLTNKARYAVMAMLEMAGVRGGAFTKVAEIASRQEIEVQFLEQIFAKLKKRGLVQAARGPGGGYKLLREIDDISVADIVRSVEEEIKMTRCSQGNAHVGCMKRSHAKCYTHHLWADLETHINSYLQSKTIGAILRSNAGKAKKFQKQICFDHNATTKMLPEVKEALLEICDYPLNGSSAHATGRLARSYLEEARRSVRALVNADEEYLVIFTSSGTEANNLALLGVKGFLPIVSVIEHASIRDLVPQALLDVDQNGVVKLESLERILAQIQEKPLVSVMLANNEIGTIQPVADIVKLVHASGGLVHTDATQCPGKMAINVAELGVDMMTIAAHKFGGPMGAAALIIRKSIMLTPVMIGGGQEYRFRSGTQNIQAISGFAVACDVEPKYRAKIPEVAALKSYIENEVRQISKEVIFFGQAAQRLGNTSSFSMPGVPAESQVMHFDLRGIAVSAGSACSSGSTKLPHVHMSMGYREDVARSAIRISLGISNTKQEADIFVGAWRDLYLGSSRAEPNIKTVI